MAVTAYRAGATSGGGVLYRYVETGTANALLTSDVTARGVVCRIVMVTVTYSAAPTQTGVTLKLKSGVSTAYDSVIFTGSANAQNNVFIPGENALYISKDDGLEIAAPAGGTSITASVAFYIEQR